MKAHAEIPQGCYIVEVADRNVWRAIRIGFYLRGVQLDLEPYEPRMDENHATVSELDLLMLAAANPEDVEDICEMEDLLGLSASA